MEATQFCHKFLEFDGTGDGYQWFIKIEQFWNAQKLEEQQKFLDIENFLRGRALAWFRLWKQYNPNADKSQQEKSTANPRSTTPFQQQQSQQQQQQNSKEEEQDEVTKLIDGGERVQRGGDRSRSNDAEISVLEMRKESEIVTDGSDWVHSSAEVVVSVEGRVEATGISWIEVKGPTRPPPEPPDLNLKTVVTGGETQRKTDPCLKTMPEASPCTTDGKAELHGAGNATDLSPVTVVLGETAAAEMFKSAHYRSMDAGGEHDASNSSAVAAEIKGEEHSRRGRRLRPLGREQLQC
ncbi:hypothetical protein PIB30_053656 [Stylosanthes scabra]|uniref:Uncharacterized protein n=1 Tax=Stylosanthes scabra TaxID=79078 RepID=A0ABU6ZHA8_9FABA|nr:hypothetical protein [Stylosanthes scabra]